MGMFPANAGSRNIKNCKEPGRHKGQLSPKLPNQKVASHIVHSTDE